MFGAGLHVSINNCNCVYMYVSEPVYISMHVCMCMYVCMHAYVRMNVVYICLCKIGCKSDFVDAIPAVP